MPEDPAKSADVDVVILIHGTFAYLSAVDEAKQLPWWTRDSKFCERLNDCLRGVAECWPLKVCAGFPWAKPGPRKQAPYYNRPIFTWSGRNSEAERRAAGRRLLQGLQTLEADGQPSYHLVGHSYGGVAIWHALLEDERRFRTDKKKTYVPLRKLRSWTTSLRTFLLEAN